MSNRDQEHAAGIRRRTLKEGLPELERLFDRDEEGLQG